MKMIWILFIFSFSFGVAFATDMGWHGIETSVSSNDQFKGDGCRRGGNSNECFSRLPEGTPLVPAGQEHLFESGVFHEHKGKYYDIGCVRSVAKHPNGKPISVVCQWKNRNPLEDHSPSDSAGQVVIAEPSEGVSSTLYFPGVKTAVAPEPKAITPEPLKPIPSLHAPALDSAHWMPQREFVKEDISMGPKPTIPLKSESKPLSPLNTSIVQHAVSFDHLAFTQPESRSIAAVKPEPPTAEQRQLVLSQPFPTNKLSLPKGADASNAELKPAAVLPGQQPIDPAPIVAEPKSKAPSFSLKDALPFFPLVLLLLPLGILIDRSRKMKWRDLFLNFIHGTKKLKTSVEKNIHEIQIQSQKQKVPILKKEPTLPVQPSFEKTGFIRNPNTPFPSSPREGTSLLRPLGSAPVIPLKTEAFVAKTQLKQEKSERIFPAFIIPEKIKTKACYLQGISDNPKAEFKKLFTFIEEIENNLKKEDQINVSLDTKNAIASYSKAAVELCGLIQKSLQEIQASTIDQLTIERGEELLQGEKLRVWYRFWIENRIDLKLPFELQPKEPHPLHFWDSIQWHFISANDHLHSLKNTLQELLEESTRARCKLNILKVRLTDVHRALSEVPEFDLSHKKAA